MDDLKTLHTVMDELRRGMTTTSDKIRAKIDSCSHEQFEDIGSIVDHKTNQPLYVLKCTHCSMTRRVSWDVVEEMGDRVIYNG